jgi:serine/threonine protein kinase/tetratricopeptide (TPR) repeat protein
MDTVFNSVGPYEIVGEIGRGGMATVFLATDTRTDRRVALKLVPAGTDREAQEILDAERWGAQLQERFCAKSRYVPEVYEHGTGGGYFYIAMEYLDGENLSDVIARGPFTPERAVDVTIQLCQFLEAAHSFETSIDGQPLRSLVHGDLKPRNIRVVPGDEIKVLDFGIAKALSLSRKVTRNDFGTFAYLSPEWFDSGGNIDSHVDLWAVGVLLYEMVAGRQAFVAPDTRRLEQRIRSRRPVAPFAAGCPGGLQAIVSKLLAGALADRYSDATAIRQDLESLKAGRTTEAERQGWPKREDEPPTRRTRPDAIPDEEATRRTTPHAAAVSPPPPQQVAHAGGAAPPIVPPSKWSRRMRRLRTALMLAALAFVFNEYRVGVRAGRLAANVATRELDGLADAWKQYDSLSGHSSNFGVIRLRRALVRQSEALADRVIGNYRTPMPTVREAQWKMAREALAHAASAAPDNAELRAALRYCEGHLHRINGEARKVRRVAAEAQHEFTDAVTAFREAAELRPNWPDPFLGLMRTFIYGLEDVDRGADALQQAQRLGYTPGDRETVQLADGYRSRGDTFARTARALGGMAQEKDYLTRAAEAYRQAVDRYSTVLAFGDAARSLRLAQRGLRQAEQRLLELTDPPAQPTPQPAESVSEAARWP